MAEQSKTSMSGHDAEKAKDQKKQLKLPIQEQALGMTGEEIDLGPILGDPSMDNPVEHHAALLSDPRFANPTNAVQRERIVSEIQRTYGNAHVQRVVNQIGYKRNLDARTTKLNESLISRKPGDTLVVQRGGLAIAALGLAVFVEGRTLATSGRLSHNANTPSYMHPNTPLTEEWETKTFILHIEAFHPRLGWGLQHFYFRVSYERNGYDIRNATINLLEDRSSRMIMSNFEIRWAGQAHSPQNAPEARIIFNISGRWDPTGTGVCSFWGRLTLRASKQAGNFQDWTITSEATDWSQRPVRVSHSD